MGEHPPTEAVAAALHAKRSPEANQMGWPPVRTDVEAAEAALRALATDPAVRAALASAMNEALDGYVFFDINEAIHLAVVVLAALAPPEPT